MRRSWRTGSACRAGRRWPAPSSACRCSGNEAGRTDTSAKRQRGASSSPRWRFGLVSRPSIDVGVGAQVLEDLLALLLVDHQVDALAVVAALDAALGAQEGGLVLLPVLVAA